MNIHSFFINFLKRVEKIKVRVDWDFFCLAYWINKEEEEPYV